MDFAHMYDQLTLVGIVAELSVICSAVGLPLVLISLGRHRAISPWMRAIAFGAIVATAVFFLALFEHASAAREAPFECPFYGGFARFMCVFASVWAAVLLLPVHRGRTSKLLGLEEPDQNGR